MKALSTAYKHIRRSPYQALAAIMIMMLTFLAISVFAFIAVGSSAIIEYFESVPQVNAFFKNGTTDEEINALAASLKQSSKVEKVTFISKEEAFKRYSELNKEDPLLLDLVSADVLPSSLEISTYKIEDLSEVAEVLKSSPDVDRVVYFEDVVAQLIEWTGALRKIGIAIITILSLVSVFIMATIIGFKISQKREEIEIMRLLSATNWYIRWPFLLEGVIYGVIGAVFGWTVATVGLLYLTPFLQSFLGNIPILPAPPLFLFGLLGFELVVAVLLGMFASFLAVLRYLK